MTAVGRDQIRKYLFPVWSVYSKSKQVTLRHWKRRRCWATSEEFYERSKLYRNRGLSLDTSILPDFAINEALKKMKTDGLLKEGSVRHIAIVGPGLDFTDKQEGYDFYPQQSIQPFALIDSLLRLRLSSPGGLDVETLDLSPRVNAHLWRAKRLAQRGTAYVVQLPRNLQAQWKADAVRYWERFGDQIGVSAQPVAISRRRKRGEGPAVRIKPAVVSRITPADVNIVLQRLEVAPAARFDLIIATNILVYYDTFEQSLAMANVEAMLRQGGFLPANNALPEFPFLPLHAFGYLTVAYSDRPNDGEHIVWYQRGPD